MPAAGHIRRQDSIEIEVHYASDLVGPTQLLRPCVDRLLLDIDIESALKRVDIGLL